MFTNCSEETRKRKSHRFHRKGWPGGLKKLKEFDFDVVITDIHMPFHSGDERVNFIRHDQKKNTPIIMLSADGEEEVIALACARA